MGHTPARRRAYHLVGSFVIAMFFIVGMATPVSALTTQATRGTAATIHTRALSSQRATNPGAQTQQQRSRCDDCGMQEVPGDQNQYQQSLSGQSDPTEIWRYLRHADYLNRTWLGHYHAGTLQPGENPAIVPHLSNRQKAIMQNESRWRNRLGLGMGVLGAGIGTFGSPPAGFAVGTYGAGICASAYDMDECLQNAGSYEAP